MNTPFSLTDAEDFILERLRHSTKISLIALSDDFTLTEYNLGFSELLGQSKNLTGKNLKNLLLPESQGLLTNAITGQNMPLRLNFVTGRGSCVSIDCYLKKTTAGYLIFADHSAHADRDIYRKMSILSNEMAAMNRELNRKNRALQEAKEQIKTLSGIIPICMYCKEIRDDKGYWNQLEKFISEHSEAQFSHGICDKCMSEKFGEKMAKTVSKKQADRD